MSKSFRYTVASATLLIVQFFFTLLAPSLAQSQVTNGNAASAVPEGSDGTQYSADVIQIDGMRRRVLYYRDKQGLIIPPPVVDGKLVDGSNAPTHPVRALNAQTRILVRYDKNALIALARIGDKDIISEAARYMEEFHDTVASGQSITSEQVRKLLFHAYVMRQAGGKFENVLKLSEMLSTSTLKMTTSEYEEIRSRAETAARSYWKEVTGDKN